MFQTVLMAFCAAKPTPRLPYTVPATPMTSATAWSSPNFRATAHGTASTACRCGKCRASAADLPLAPSRPSAIRGTARGAVSGRPALPGMIAPISHKKGNMKPIMPRTQCPLRKVMRASVKISTR